MTFSLNDIKRTYSMYYDRKNMTWKVYKVYGWKDYQKHILKIIIYQTDWKTGILVQVLKMCARKKEIEVNVRMEIKFSLN